MNTLKVRWFLPIGFYVRSITRTGYVNGFLTDRGGWGGPHLARKFATYEDAIAACAKFRRAEVIENVGATR